MRVGGGANCHDFVDKHLFYGLFGRPTSIHVAGGSTFSVDIVGLVTVVLPGYLTLHLFAPDYWTPTDRTNTLSISALKLYRFFCSYYHESLSS